jgi:hypothetical protein
MFAILLKKIYISEECAASIFRAEDGSSIFLQNAGTYISDYTA